MLARWDFDPRIYTEMILIGVSGRRALPRLGSTISLRRSHSMPFAAACHERGDPAAPHPMEYSPQ